MRWINRAIALAALLTISSIAAWAQTPECTDDLKTAKYSEWYDNRKDKQDVAYKAAVDFLTACPNEPEDGAWGPQVKALKKFKVDYEALNSSKELATKFDTAVKSNNYADQIKYGKQLVAANSDNTLVYIYMAAAGANDLNLAADAIPAAKKAIELIEAGKPFAPAFQNSKDVALATLNYSLAKMTAKSSPTDAIPYFIKAAKYESPLKKDARIYNELAAAYAEQVAKLTQDYQPFVGKSETTESKLVLANLNQAMDAQIDALARATALADAANKPALMERLTQVYEDRNKKKDGVDQLVAGILAKPLPDPPKPITELPSTPTPGTPPVGTSGASGNGSAAGSAAGSSTTGSPKPTSTAPTSNIKPATPGTTPAKPTATPTPRPRQRANHRG
ncbi:MAG TPA: hypothetical protein VN696_02720 [Pyrinomonadaceae bacterium]|nr:hypothetical protein [Pyrinomonadaceae bacterium]